MNNKKNKYKEYFISPDADGKEIKANRIDPNRRSNLYILRRNLIELYGPENDDYSKIKAPLLTATGILNGLEVLSKIYKTNNNEKKIQFLDFINKDIEDTAQILSNLRHGLVHKQSLINIDSSGTKYFFTITETKDISIKVSDNNRYEISIYYLKKIFLYSVKFVTKLVINEILYQKNFDKVEQEGFFWLEIN